MTVAAFVHPFNVSQSVLVCRATHLTPAMQLKLINLALKEGNQIIVVGEHHPHLREALGHLTPACTPEAIRADLIEAPGPQHALAQVRSTPRHTFILQATGEVIGTYASVLTRPGEPDHPSLQGFPPPPPLTQQRPAIPGRWDGRVGRHATS